MMFTCDTTQAELGSRRPRNCAALNDSEGIPLFQLSRVEDTICDKPNFHTPVYSCLFPFEKRGQSAGGPQKRKRSKPGSVKVKQHKRYRR